MPRVCLVALAALALSVGAVPSPVLAQKGKPTTPPIGVTATFTVLAPELLAGPSPQSVDDAIQPVEGCTFDGAIAADTGHFTTSASACDDAAFGSSTFADVGGGLQPSTMASAVSYFVRNVGKALPGGSPIAGQFGLSWTGMSVDSGPLPYRLQFGDVYDESIDYARTTCVTVDNPVCQEWQVTSLEGTAPTGDATVRGTGPFARLSVVTGPGSRGVRVLASQLEVPYTIRIVRKQP